MTSSQATTVFLTYQTLGGYLRDPNSLEANFSNSKEAAKALDTLLSNLVIEANSIDKIQDFNLDTAISRIQDSYHECVIERREIEAAQAAEDILQAAAIAANVALAAVSWTVFGAIGLSITTSALEIAAQLADLGVKELENSIIKTISDMGLKAHNDPALQNIKSYHDATDQVSTSIAILELGGNKTIVRQSLLGLARKSKTVDKMKSTLVQFFDVTQRNDRILQEFINLGEYMLKGDGGPDAQEVLVKLKDLNLPKGLLIATISTFAATGIVLVKAMQKFQKQMTPQLVKLAQVEGFAALESLEEIASLSAKSTKMAIAVRSLAALGAALEVGLLGLSIYEQRSFIDKINKAMNERREALIKYYTDLYVAITGKVVTTKPPTSDSVGVSILYQAQPNFCLNLHRNDAKDGGIVNLWSVNDNESQLWNLYSDGTIRHHAHPDFCLNLHRNDARDGGVVNLWSVNGNESQRWSMHPDGTIRHHAHPDFCLNLHRNETKDGGVVNLWSVNGNKSQHWQPRETVTILHQAQPNFCLNLDRNDAKDGGVVNLWSVNGNGSQRWNIYSDGTIRHQAQPNFCLNLHRNDAKDGGVVNLWSVNGHESQRWSVHPDGTIRHQAHPDFCLNLHRNETKDGGVINLWSVNGHESQRWQLG